MRRKCPYCGKECDTQGLKNHIRLCDDSEHGPAGSVPDGFDSPGGDEIVVTDPVNGDDVAISEAFESVLNRVGELSERVEYLEGGDDS